MELAKGNDVYSYFHDLLSDKGARNLRNNIKKEFISLPAGAEEIEEKINTVKDKIETSKLTDEQKVKYLNKLKEEAYFNEGMECYLKGDLSGAIIKWTLTISINPEDPNAYYSRAVVKDALFTWKAALKDYDKALELAPGFVGALINRGNLKLENGDNEGALDDYNRVLTLEQNDREIITSIYFNRGNAKYLLGNKTGACEDWTRATEFGADYAQERIEEYCR